MPQRKLARVLPEPVGAQISVWAPLEIAFQPPAWAGVGPSKDPSNQRRTGALKGASGSDSAVCLERGPTHRSYASRNITPEGPPTARKQPQPSPCTFARSSFSRALWYREDYCDPPPRECREAAKCNLIYCAAVAALKIWELSASACDAIPGEGVAVLPAPPPAELFSRRAAGELDVGLP